MKFLNRFFFGSDEISTHDFCWFYGFWLFSIIAFIFIIGVYVQLYLDKY